jgi:hypothetical protein
MRWERIRVKRSKGDKGIGEMEEKKRDLFLYERDGGKKDNKTENKWRKRNNFAHIELMGHLLVVIYKEGNFKCLYEHFT